MKNQTKQVLRIVLFLGTAISLFYVPWPILKAWIKPLPDTVQAQVNEAIDSRDVEQLKLRVGVCMRGLQAMDRTATESGAQAASDEVWLVQADGREFGLLRDPMGWQRAQEKHPGVTLVTEREMVLALEMFRRSAVGQTIEAVKDSFPGATVVEIRDSNLNDEIPWC